MMPSSRKNKGRKLQQHTRDRLLEVFELEDGDVESRPMGSAGSDLLLSAKARKRIGISFECKNTVGTPSRSQLQQSQNNKIPNTLASVVWKPKGVRYTQAMILFDLEEFLNFYKERTGNESD